MAITFGFYNSVAHDRRYNAVQMSMIFDGIIRDGIYSTIGEGMVVKKSVTANSVIIAPGRGWFDHSWIYNDADEALPGYEPELFLDRIDAVVVDINSNDDFRANSVVWVKGSPSVNPVRPAMIKTLDHHQYPLAYVYRKANITDIKQTDITNMVGTTECPFVTGILQTMSIDNLVLQWKDQWAQFVIAYEDSATQWMDDQKADFAVYYREFKLQADAFQVASGQEFSTWFEMIQGIFDGDVGGHLQNEIDEITEREFNRHYGLTHSITSINDVTGVITTTTSEAEEVTRFATTSTGDIITTTLTPSEGSFAYVKTTTITNEETGTRIETSYVKRPK